MKALWGFTKAVGHRIYNLFSLIKNWDDVRETYGDNPNNISEEERLVAHGVASNIINSGSFGM